MKYVPDKPDCRVIASMQAVFADECSYVGMVYVPPSGLRCSRVRNNSLCLAFRPASSAATDYSQFQFETMASLVRYYRRKYVQHRQIIDHLKADGADLKRSELTERLEHA